MPASARFLTRFFRQNSTSSKSSVTTASFTDLNDTASTTTATTTNAQQPTAPPTPTSQEERRRRSSSIARLRGRFADQARSEPTIPEARESALLDDGDFSKLTPALLDLSPRRSGSETLAAPVPSVKSKSFESITAEEIVLTTELEPETPPQPLLVTLQAATPIAPELDQDGVATHSISRDVTLAPSTSPDRSISKEAADATSSRSVSPGTAPGHARRQSLQHDHNAKIVHSLVDAPARRDVDGGPISTSTALPTSAALDYFTPGLPNLATMLHRKIWVRRPGASATLVQIRQDDLVDDVRDMILKKYANSLGRTFDSPDMTLRIALRSEHGGPKDERLLGPEEDMCKTIDSYYPGGQTVDDALIIDVPQKRTPRPSPKVAQHMNYHQNYQALDEYRPLESGTDYFPQMPVLVPATAPQSSGSHDNRPNQHHPSNAGTGEHHRSISVLNTGQIPPLPSPGGGRRHRDHRPRIGRQHTASPTLLSHPTSAGIMTTSATQSLNPMQAHLPHRSFPMRSRLDSSASEHPIQANGAPAPPPLPTPPAPEALPNNNHASTPPTPSSTTAANPLRSSRPPKKGRKITPDKLKRHQRNDSERQNKSPAPASGMLDGSVPPINVLIVEDNIINLRILEGLMKRLKVRWQTAMNGQIAVDSWRKGGFHLVLMDIQMPIMNGLAATKEIRRLERVNGIGVFSSSSPTSPAERTTTNGDSADPSSTTTSDEHTTKPKDPQTDRLSTSEGLFKSPVIIVALTASSLQSDRHEALAAGCNDFLTKPVNFVWLERKVKEWGCMQALIDFDGWRRWKDYAAKEEAGKSEEQRLAEAEKEEKQRVKMEKFAKLQEKRVKKEEEEKRKKRASMESSSGAGAAAAAQATGDANGGGSNGVLVEE